MEGTIEVQSKPTVGTNIYISIPLSMANVKDLEQMFIEVEPQSIGFEPIHKKDRPVLLLAEDNKDLREYIRHILDPFFDVVESENGKEALEILKKNQDVDIILSDIMMPEMDGITFLSKVKNDRKLRLKPFVFLTAKHNTQDIFQAYRMGVDDYLKKPFTEDELLHRLNAIYQNYRERINFQFEEENRTSQNNNFGEVSSFINKLHTMIIENLAAHDFSVLTLSEKLGVSNRNFIRLVKKEIGMSPKDYIREVRLNQARQILNSGESDNPHVVARMVGFGTTSYFLKLYYQRFGSRFGA